MSILVELARRVAHLFRRNAGSDLEEEMRFHLDMKAQSYREAGMNERLAADAAKKQVGNTLKLVEESRAAWGWSTIESCWQDIRYTLRGLRKSPSFASVAIVSLALGIGANTIVFSVLNALILRDLPIKDPQQVFSLNQRGKPNQSFPNYLDIRDRNSVFESLFATRIVQVSIGDERGARMLWGYLVTGNYFETLGIKPAVGRFFGPAEDRVLNGSPYAVLSYPLWQRRFGSDPGIVGQTIRINGHPYTVTGVAPQGFHGTELYYWSDVWVPMTMQSRVESYDWLPHRTSYNAAMFGRLKPNVTVAEAEANLQIVAAGLAKEHKSNEGMTLKLSPPGLFGDAGRKPMTAFLNGLMLLAALVLLAACVNLASLLSARTADRMREIAIRISIGAGRGRVVRQILTESLVISLLGGTAGCVLGYFLLGLLNQWRAPLDLPIYFDIAPDWRVFSLTCSISVVTGLLFSLGAIRQTWKTDPAAGMKNTAAHTKFRFASRDVLLPIQVTICCVLVIASLVSVRGMMRSFQTPLGFMPDHVAVVGYNTTLTGYSKQAAQAFHQQAIESIRQLPGLTSVAYSSSVPMSINQSTTTIYPVGTTDFRPKNEHHPIYYYVSSSYFRTIGTSLLKGRMFTENEKSPRIAIVNQTLARRVVGTEDAVGRLILRGQKDTVEIVGVVEDGKYETLTEDPKMAIYFPFNQDDFRDTVILARTNRPESELAAEMRSALVKLDPQVPIFSVGSLRQMLALAYLPMQAAVVALGAFGLLAAMLAATGVYGISAYAVSRRVREIGIRMAVGAQRGQILRLIFGRTGKLVAAGAVVGLALGMAGAKLLESIVYQANSRDPLVIAATILSIAGIAVVAAWGPARRAMKVNPVDALRSE